MLRRLLAVGFRVAPLALGIACASPSLPLPPPSPPTQEAGPDADHVQLIAGCGGAEAQAIVLVINSSAPSGKDATATRADGCGAWSMIVYAHKGDYLNISQISGTDGSLTQVVPVR